MGPNIIHQQSNAATYMSTHLWLVVFKTQHPQCYVYLPSKFYTHKNAHSQEN